MADKDSQRLRLGRLYSLGIELAAAVAGFTLLGYWIDRHYGSHPWGILICVALGLIGGMVNFLRSALREVRQPPAKKQRPDGREGP